MSARKWFLIPSYKGHTMFDARHHIEPMRAAHTACGMVVTGQFTQHYPKKQPPLCKACALANKQGKP